MKFWKHKDKDKDNADAINKAFFEQQTLTFAHRSPHHKIKWVHDEPFGRWCIHVENNDNSYHGYVWQEDETLNIREWCGFCGSQHNHEPHIIGPLECVVAAVEAYLMHQLGIRQTHATNDDSHQRKQSVSRK